MPGPDGSSNAVSVPPAGRAVPSDAIVSMLMRTCIAIPRGPGTSPWPSPSAASVRPAASSSCSRTRSSPVTSSVTVCSTCRRGLASMKAKAASSPPSASTRNSTVARLSRPAARASATRRLEDPLPHPHAEPGRRRDLDQLLALALDAALALPEVGDAAGRDRRRPAPRCGGRAGSSRSDVDVAIAERLQRLRPAPRVGRLELIGVAARGASRARRRRQSPSA